MSRPALLLFATAILAAASARGAAGGAGDGAGVADAGRAAPEIVGLRVGFEGRYKTGLWTPVEVTVVGLGDAADRGDKEDGPRRLTLTAPDGDGVPSRVTVELDEPGNVEPAADAAATVVGLVRFGRVSSPLRVEVLDARGATLAARTFKAAEDGEDAASAVAAGRVPPGLEHRALYLEIGPAPSGVEEAVRLLGASSESRPVTVRIEDFARLPRDWLGYEGVDAVVLSTLRPEIYAAADVARLDALDRWVRTGGRLVLGAGVRAEEALAGDAPLARFAPGRFERTVPLRQTGAIESFARGSMPVPRAPGGDALRAVRLADVRGVVEVREADLPLIVRSARGFGQVVFVAVDLDAPPLSDWADRGRMVERLIDLPAAADEDASASAAVMHYGYRDVAGQLRSAVGQFEGVRPISFSTVAFLVAAYVLLIGPLDYFVLRRFARRMVWTWLTFPAVVAVAVAAAWAAAVFWKGSAVRAHQVDLVDVDAASGVVRGTSWAGVFSPRAAMYDVGFRPGSPSSDADEERIVVAWVGLPGGALGGMSAQPLDAVRWGEHYDFAPRLDAMRRAPIQVWSTKTFTARWSARTNVLPDARLRLRGDLPEGSIANTLDVPLADCVLFCGRFAYELGTIEPGRAATIDDRLRRSELKTHLTGRRIVFGDKADKPQHVIRPYDLSSTDAEYVLRTMMFFEAAGGRRYTGLVNHYQGFVDLGALLRADRAVLVARGPSGAAARRYGGTFLDGDRPLAGDDPQHAVYFRFVLPLDSEEP